MKILIILGDLMVLVRVIYLFMLSLIDFLLFSLGGNFHNDTVYVLDTLLPESSTVFGQCVGTQ